MAYSDGEVLIESIILALPEFDRQNVSRADWGILNNGKSDHYAILRRGAMGTRERAWIAPTVYVARWTTYIEVWQKVLPDIGQTHSELYRHTESIMTILDQPGLGDATATIQDSNIPGIGEPEEMWSGSGGPVFLRLVVELAWDEERTVVY